MTRLTFPTGIEIEVGNDNTVPPLLVPKTWTAGTDASAGLEFRSSKIVDTDTLFGDTQKMCSLIQHSGCHIHHKCGLHVHIGFDQIGDLSAKYRLFRFVSTYEDLFFQLMPPWTERSKYCTKLKQPMWESFQRGEGFNCWKTGETARYWWFNGAAMLKHGTVEFRHMNGTLNSDEILGWVAVLQCLFQATVHEDVKLGWRDLNRATPTQLVEDLHCATNPIFGDLAANFITDKAAQACYQ